MSGLTAELVDACVLVPPVEGGDAMPGTPSNAVRVAQLVPTRFLHLWVRDPAGEELEGLGLPMAPSGALSTFLFESSLTFSSCLMSADTVVQVLATCALACYLDCHLVCACVYPP